MSAQLRNVRTGEITEVEPYSDEWNDKLAERYDAGGGVVRPTWEQTGEHHAQRLANGDAQIDHDFGYEDKPISVPGAVRVEDILADPRPHEELTAGEKEMGLKSWDQKSKELDEMRAELVEVDTIGSTPVAERVSSGLERVTGDSSPKRRPVRRSGSKAKAGSSSSSGSGSGSGSGSASSGGSGSGS